MSRATNDDLRRDGSRGAAESDHMAIFVDLGEKKCSGEVKLDGSGVPVVPIDSRSHRRLGCAARSRPNSGADLRAARARPVGDPPGTFWVRPGALPSSHGPSRAKVAHDLGVAAGNLLREAFPETVTRGGHASSGAENGRFTPRNLRGIWDLEFVYVSQTTVRRFAPFFLFLTVLPP